MVQKIRTALLGYGHVGPTHADALQALPHSEFVAVGGPTPEKVAAFARRYGVKAYTDLERMLVEAKVQMLVIATPHPTHAAQIEVAAKHKVHLLIEKPLASDLADCDRAITACERAGVKLGVISQRRYYEPVVRMRRAIEAGKIGRPILATCTVMGWRGQAYYQSGPWRGRWDTEGGGVLVNQTPHQLDLFQWLMGPIDELFGYWDNLNHPYVEIEDTAVAVVRFKSGALGQILVSNSQKPGLYGKVHIHGSTGASVGAQTEGGSPFISGVTMEEMQSVENRRAVTRRVALNAAFFVFGFSLVFILLGWTASSAGQFLLSYLHIFNRFAGAVLVIFGLHVMGILRIRFLNYEKRFQARTKPIGVWGALVIGLAFAFGWTPCIGPILAGVLAIAAQAESQWQGVGLLTVYSAGLGVPFFLTAIAFNRFLGFFGWMRRHFRAVEIVSGFFLVLVGILIFTNSLSVIAARLLQWFPALGTIG